MFSKRFVLLVSVLMTLNIVLWFASPGLAIRRAIVQQLFGPKLIRAEVIDRSGGATVDWRLDRGVITNVTSSQLTLREADGKIQAISLSSSTKVIHLGQRLSLSALASRWRVLVEWPLNGPARSVDVEKIPRTRHPGS